jgi:tetratricopeptide (TPR) repeat protein
MRSRDACETASAQPRNAIDTLAAQMNEAGQTGRNAEGLALAQKLEGLVRQQQGADNMNYAGVLHNERMFLHNLGRYQEAIDKLNAALAIKLRNNDPASTLRSSKYTDLGASHARSLGGCVSGGRACAGDRNPPLSPCRRRYLTLLRSIFNLRAGHAAWPTLRSPCGRKGT